MEQALLESELSQLGRAENDTNVGTTNPGVLYGSKIHLGKSNLAIDKNTAYAALSAQEANFTGYAAQVVAITWGDPVTAADGTVEVVSEPVTFAPTDAVVDNSIYNLWLSNGGSSAWYFAAPIADGPLPMSSTLDQIIVILRFRPAQQTIAVIIA